MTYGLILDAIKDARDYVLGGTKMPFIPYMEDGDWTEHLPKYEAQAEDFETNGCTVWGTQNQCETFFKGVYGFEPNFSERYNYLLTPVNPDGGADPQKVYQCVREHGLVDHNVLPMEDTREEFLDKSDLTGSVLAKGQRWLRDHDFRYELLWVFYPGKEKALAIMKEALTTSPLGISVTAWRQGPDGKYVDQGIRNNHWCMAYKIDEEGIHAFDTYDHSRKLLSLDHFIARASRIHINRKTRSSSKKHLGLLAVILKRFMNKKTLVEVAEEYLGKDASPNDAAPDELGCADSVTAIMQKAGIPVPTIVSTIMLTDWLSNPKNGFMEVGSPMPGDIIVSPTSGSKIGHTGIYMDEDIIASNDSGLVRPANKGKFLKNYSTSTWARRYRDKLGLPVYVFRKA